MKNNLRNVRWGAPLHTLSKLYDVPVGFVNSSLILRLCIALLASPKFGCCSMSDDLSCSCKFTLIPFAVWAVAQFPAKGLT